MPSWRRDFREKKRWFRWFIAVPFFFFLLGLTLFGTTVLSYILNLGDKLSWMWPWGIVTYAGIILAVFITWLVKAADRDEEGGYEIVE